MAEYIEEVISQISLQGNEVSMFKSILSKLNTIVRTPGFTGTSTIVNLTSEEEELIKELYEQKESS